MSTSHGTAAHYVICAMCILVVTLAKHVLLSYLKGIVPQYKAQLLLNELISSKIQSKWVQEVWAHPESRYSAQECAEVECVQNKDFVDD